MENWYLKAGNEGDAKLRREMGEMTSDKREESVDLIHVYRPYWRFSYWIIVAFCSSIVLVDIRSLIMRGPRFNDWLGEIVVLVFFIHLILLFYISAVKTKIVVTPEHFEYYGIGYRIQSQWEDLIRIHRFTWDVDWGRRGKHNPDHLILRRVRIKGPKWLRRYIRFTGQAQVIAIGYFDPWWRESALGDDIRYFAPQLNI